MSIPVQLWSPHFASVYHLEVYTPLVRLKDASNKHIDKPLDWFISVLLLSKIIHRMTKKAPSAIIQSFKLDKENIFLK